MKKDPIHQAILESPLKVKRRQFLSRMSVGIGSAAMGSLLIPDLFSRPAAAGDDFIHVLPNFAPTAKRLIYLFPSWVPSPLAAFDYRLGLRDILVQVLLD